MKNVSDKALTGIKIIEYCGMVSGPYCAKLMADMGAEVIKIEPPGRGDEARNKPPFLGDVPHPEKSALFLYLNSNKLGITLDPLKPEGKKIFLDLIKGADVLIEDRAGREMEENGLTYNDLKAFNPGLIMASISPFGRTGPFRDYKAQHLNIAHVSGQGYMLPIPSLDPNRPPVKAGANSGDYDPGLVASLSVMAALFWKGATGQGQFIDVSKQEALMSMQRVESVTYANDGVSMTRDNGPQRRSPGGVVPCKDGHVVVVTPEEHQWQALLKLMGDQAWTREEWCVDPQQRSENGDKVRGLMEEWMKEHTKDEIFHKGQALSVPIAPVNSARDVVESDQYGARDFFVGIEHPEVGRLDKFPSSPYRFSKTPWSLERPAPLLGEHNEEIFQGRLGLTEEETADLKQSGII